MAEEREILKYELDIADVEAKSQRLRQIGEQNRAADERAFTDWRAQEKANEAFKRDLDQAEFQVWRKSTVAQELTGETVAFRDLTKSQDANAMSVATLIAHKRQLAAAVALAGGEFGGLVAQLASVTTMMLSAVPAVAAVAGGLAAIAIGANAFRSVEEGAKAAAKAQTDLNEAVREFEKLQGEPAQRIATELEKRGALSEQNVSVAWALRRELMKQYRQPDPELAAAATAAGVTSIDDAAVLGELKVRGQEPKGGDAVRKALEMAKQGPAYADLLRAAQQRREVSAFDLIQAMGENTAGAPPQQTPQELAFETLKASGRLPLGIKSVEEFRARLERSQRDRTRIREIDQEAAWQALGLEGAPSAEVMAKREGLSASRLAEGVLLEKEVEHARQLQAGRVPGVTTMPAPEAGLGDSPAVREVIDALRENTAAQRGTPLQPTAASINNVTNVAHMAVWEDERNSHFDIPFGTGRIDERGQPY